MKRDKCRLLLCGPFPAPVGGVSIHLRRLQAALQRDGRFVVQGIDEAGLRKPELFNIRSLNIWRYLSLLWWADLVHVQSSVGLFRLMHVLAARLLFRPVMVTLHSHRPGNAVEHWMVWLSCAFAHKVIAVNADIQRSVCPRAVVIPAYIAPGADEEWLPSEIASWASQVRAGGRQLLVSNAYKLVQFAGADLYGLDILLDLLERQDVRERYALVFVVSSLADCEAPYLAAQKRIQERSMQNDVLLVNQAMPFAGLLKCCDVSVRATNTDGDALSVRESLSYGKRTLASDCVLRPAGTELFATRNTDALAALLMAPARPAEAELVSYDKSIINLYEALS